MTVSFIDKLTSGTSNLREVFIREIVSTIIIAFLNTDVVMYCCSYRNIVMSCG